MQEAKLVTVGSKSTRRFVDAVYENTFENITPLTLFNSKTNSFTYASMELGKQQCDGAFLSNFFVL